MGTSGHIPQMKGHSVPLVAAGHPQLGRNRDNKIHHMKHGRSTTPLTIVRLPLQRASPLSRNWSGSLDICFCKIVHLPGEL